MFAIARGALVCTPRAAQTVRSVPAFDYLIRLLWYLFKLLRSSPCKLIFRPLRAVSFSALVPSVGTWANFQGDHCATGLVPRPPQVLGQLIQPLQMICRFLLVAA